MNFELPTRNDLPAFSYLIELEGGQFLLSYNFNQRMDRWLFSIATSTEIPILSNIVMIANTPLTAQYTDPRLPSGNFIAFDTSGTNTDPGRFDLGDRVVMVFNT